jgi:pilus assembly protein CpaE
MIFETNAEVLDLLYEALPEAWGAQSFAALEDANGAHFHPKYGLVLVLGPSQVSDATLERVSAVLKTVPAAAAVLVVERPSAELMRVALRAGVDDAVELSSVGLHLANTVSELADRLERELADAAFRADDLRGVSSPRRGLVTSVFSPKGGVGKSVISVNLAAALARRTGEPVVILDLDLQFGDVAVMLRLQPLHTFRDAVSAGNLLDQALLGSFLARHEKSGVYVLAAPTSPEVDQVDPVAMLRVLGLLREMFAYIVVDTPPHLSEVVLQAVAASDTVAFVVAMDVPSVKNASRGLRTFELLQLPLGKVLLLLNRAHSRVHLTDRDIERVLEMRVDLAFPSEVIVPQSVNQGSPALLTHPRSRFSVQMDHLAELVLVRAEEALAPAVALKQ